jgi:hypothetical protein
LDCDKDGNPNSTDLNPQVATANNDVLNAPFGVTSAVSVLSNDDFLPVLSTVITRTGGDAVEYIYNNWNHELYSSFE